MKRILIAVSMAALVAGCAGDKKKHHTPVLGERLPVLVYEAEAEPDPELADATIALPVAQTNGSWSQAGGNAAKSLGHVTLPKNLSRAWTVSIGKGASTRAGLESGPVVADGKVFTIDTSANVRAVDARSGKTVWDAQLSSGGEEKTAAFGGGVGYADGKIYATSGWGRVAAFDAANGKRLWSVSVGAPVRSAPSIAADRVVFVTQDNQLIALSTSDGSTLWQQAATVEASGLFGAAAPAIALDTVVAGFSSGELLAARIENSRVVWQETLAPTGISTSVSSLSDIDASPVIDQGRVFAIGEGGRMVAVELATGQRVWEVNIAGLSTPWVAGDWIYVVTSDSRLLCLSRGTGKVRWASQLPAWRDKKKKTKPIRWAGPVLASEGLFLVSNTGHMISASPYDGKIVSDTKLGGEASLPPVVANNMLYVLTDDGKLSAWR